MGDTIDDMSKKLVTDKPDEGNIDTAQLNITIKDQNIGDKLIKCFRDTVSFTKVEMKLPDNKPVYSFPDIKDY
jgi:hypothetical protein